MEEIEYLNKQIVPAFSEEILAQFPKQERNDYRNYKIFPIELLVKADWNYKEENVTMSNKLRDNLKRNGQIETIHLRLLDTGYYEVVNGNHRYDEMVILGRKTIIAYDHGKISKEEAIRRCLETNETRFDSDKFKLAGLIKELSNSFDMSDLVQTMPYSEEELNNMAVMNDFKGEFKNTEINIDELDMEIIFKLKFSEKNYYIVKEKLAEIADSPEEAILKLLENEQS